MPEPVRAVYDQNAHYVEVVEPHGSFPHQFIDKVMV